MKTYNKMVQRSINLPKDVLEELNKIAKNKYVSVNDLIRESIIKYIKEYNEKK